MPVLTAPAESNVWTSDAIASPPALSLRVSRRGEEQVRKVELVAGKCTVGSSPQCQVCLPSPDVRPLQCLINVDGAVAAVTRWAPGVKLNGHDFSRAELNDGDQLTAGEWVVEFVSDPKAQAEQSATFEAAEESLESKLDSLTEMAFAEAEKWAAPEPAASTLPDLVVESTPVPDWAVALESSVVKSEPDAVVSDESHVAAAAPTVDDAAALPAVCLSSNAFADRLVLHLWTANDRSRRRARALITGLRAARFQAEALMADLSAIETELDLARAAYDSHLGNDERLQQELARQHEERVAPLLEQISSLQAELEQVHTSIAQQTAAYEALASELIDLQEAAKTPAIDPALAQRAEELEAAVAAQTQQLERVTNELQFAREEQSRLAEQYRQEVERHAQEASRANVEAERSAVLETAAAAHAGELELLTNQLQQAQLEQQRLAELHKFEADRCGEESARAAAEAERAATLQSTVANHSLELEKLAAELLAAQQEQERLSELYQSEAQRAAQFAQALLDQQALIEAAATDAQEPETLADLPATKPETEPEPEPALARQEEQESGPLPGADEAQVTPAPDLWKAAMPTVQSSVAEPRAITEPTAPIIADQPAVEHSPPSFIDKYRHLLEADETPSPLRAVPGARPVIDDEFLSPAKAESGLSPADESDDVLEAYMANMMRRVRGATSEPQSSSSPASLDSLLQSPGSPTQAIEITAPEPLAPLEPLNLEDMKNATRKLPLASDFAALREIANSSARTAIAKHNHKQVRDSAVSKIAIALTAAASSAYIMTSSPGIDDWQFWGGATTAVLGVGAAIQAILIERRSRVRWH